MFVDDASLQVYFFPEAAVLAEILGQRDILHNYYLAMKPSRFDMSIQRQSEAENTVSLAVDDTLNSRIDRLRMRHMRLLDQVARTGSLSAAAGVLGMSQPGATKMLQELEAAFGCTLIERSAKGGQLTQAGSHVLDRMRIALHSVSTAHTTIGSRKEVPLVRLGIIPLVGIQALRHVVGLMQSENTLPRIQIQLGTVEGLLQALHEGLADCVVGFLDETTTLNSISRFQVITLWRETLVVVASCNHPLTSRKSVPLAVARDFDWVLMPKLSSNRRAIDRMFLNAGLTPPTPHIETESFHISLSIVAGSKMLAAVPESAYLQYKSQVSILPMEVRFPSTTLVFVTLSDGPKLPSVEMISQAFQAYAHMLDQANGQLLPVSACVG